MTRLVQGTIAFDFDGVLSEGAGYHWPRCRDAHLAATAPAGAVAS